MALRIQDAIRRRTVVILVAMGTLIAGGFLVRFGTLSPCEMLKKDWKAEFFQSQMEHQPTGAAANLGFGLGLLLAPAMVDRAVDALSPLQCVQGLVKVHVEGKKFAAATAEPAVSYAAAETLRSLAPSSPAHDAYLAKINRALIDINLLKVAVDLFRLDLGRYPTRQEGLDALRKRLPHGKRWNGPYYKNELPLDPWGHAYHYSSAGNPPRYEIESYGADAQSGGSNEDADIHGDG